MDKVDVNYRQILEKVEAEIKDLKKQLADTDKQIDKFYDFVCDGGDVDERARERYRQLKAKYEKLSAKLEEKEASRPANISKATIRKYIERYRREMETGKAPNLKGTIAAFVDKITVSDSNITIRYRFEPTLSRIDKFDLYGALGGSRTHAFSSGG